MVLRDTLGIETAWSRTRILTFLRQTSTIWWTILMNNTFRATIWWCTEHTTCTRTNGTWINFATFSIWSTWTWETRILVTSRFNSYIRKMWFSPSVTIQRSLLTYILTFWLTLLKRIADIICRATTYWIVVFHLASGVKATCTRTWIFTFLIDAC